VPLTGREELEASRFNEDNQTERLDQAELLEAKDRSDREIPSNGRDENLEEQTGDQDSAVDDDLLHARLLAISRSRYHRAFSRSSMSLPLWSARQMYLIALPREKDIHSTTSMHSMPDPWLL
jgi:hypothetical protein